MLFAVIQRVSNPLGAQTECPWSSNYMKETFRCWAEIDREALRQNAKVVRQRIGSAEMLAVVKANAYGHGLLGVAQTLADDAQLFGVANLEEGLALRESLSHPVVILGPAT